jgi:hypothetical protein
MTIEYLCEALESAHDAYQSGGTARMKKARYQRLLHAATSLSTRLGEACTWLEAHFTNDDAEDTWIDVLNRYERGWVILERAKSWV